MNKSTLLAVVLSLLLVGSWVAQAQLAGSSNNGPTLQSGKLYSFGLPGGAEMPYLIESAPVGQWVQCKSAKSGRSVWVNLNTVLYVYGGQ